MGRSATAKKSILKLSYFLTFGVISKCIDGELSQYVWIMSQRMDYCILLILRPSSNASDL